MKLADKIKGGILNSIYPSLYSSQFNEDLMNERFKNLVEKHNLLFKNDDIRIFSTAGRTELAGNHTDHNLGKVLAASINLDTIAAVSKSNNNIVSLISEGFPIVMVNLDDLNKKVEEENTTDSLIRGIAKGFVDRGLKIEGFNANTSTNVLKGSGLSSSAAIEILCATIFNTLFNNEKLNPVELSIISQYAENNYYGKPSGLMDQIACSSGGIVSIDFKEENNPIVENIDFSFEKEGYNLVIVDTKGNHEDLTHCYSAIPKEMKSVASFFNKKVLREVSKDEFFETLPELRNYLNNDRALLRAIHFYNENERVEKIVSSIKNNNISSIFDQINKSGNSSFCFLQNLYDPHGEKEQGLSLAIALSKDLLKKSGAVRVHGGGFAGTIQAFVPHNLINIYKEKMDSLFGEGSTTILAIRKVKTTCIL